MCEIISAMCCRFFKYRIMTIISEGIKSVVATQNAQLIYNTMNISIYLMTQLNYLMAWSLQ